MVGRRARTTASFVVLSSITACAAIFGISDPEIERAAVEGGPGADAFVEATANPDSSGLSCPSGFFDCNGDAGDGCEENAGTSSAHCGRCGHSCLGGACSDGGCQPVELSQPDAGNCAGYVVVRDEVFFNAATQVSVQSVPKDGGATKTWLTFNTGNNAVGFANGLFVDQDFVAGSHYYARNIFALRDGGILFNLGPCPGTPLGMFRDGTNFYAMQTEPCGGGNGSVRQMVVVDGGFVEQWSVDYGKIGTAEPEWIATDATSIYFVADRETQNEGVYKMSHAGTGKTKLAGGAPYSFGPTPLRLDGSRLYARRGNAIIAIDTDPATGVVTELATNQDFIVTINNAYLRMSIAFDATHVYWTARDGSVMSRAKIMRVAKTPGAPVETLVTGLPFGFGMDVDDVAVYWTTTEGVFRVAK